MDICGADREMDEAFRREFGPAGETTLQSLQRGYSGFTNRLYNNVRRAYDEQCDLLSQVDDFAFASRLFRLRSTDNVQLACCFLENRAHPSSRRVVVFLHTNSSNMLQGLDLQKVCVELGASLIMYDLRGSGKSDGPGLSNLHKHKRDLDLVIAWARGRAKGHSVSTAALATLSNTSTPPSGSAAAAAALADEAAPVEILLWARGMSCATAIAHASDPSNRPATYPITFIVLDSPYESIEKMTTDGFARIRASGWYLPDAVLSVGTGLVRSHLSGKLGGMDPYDVRPVDCVEQCFTPACALIATDDDYVPVDQGLEVASRWAGPMQAKQFVGSHFGARDADDLMWVSRIARIFLHKPIIPDGFQGMPESPPEPEPVPEPEPDQQSDQQSGDLLP